MAPVFDLGVGMDPEISGCENIIVRGLFLGMTRKQMEQRIDEIADFTELGDFLRDAAAHLLDRHADPARPGRGDQHRSGDPDPRRGHRGRRRRVPGEVEDRLKELVDRAGLLVFASHSDEFLRELCDTAIWMEHGRIREHGAIEEVLAAYKGRRVSRRRQTVRRGDRHPGPAPSCCGRAWPPWPARAGAPTTSSSSTTGRTTRSGRRSRRAGCPPPTCRSRRNLGGAGGFALGMLHALALGADWVWCADDDGRPADDAVLATLLDAAERHGLAEVSPGWSTDMADPEPAGLPAAPGPALAARRSDFAGIDVLPHYASLFNGALFRADALDVVGVPDYRLFFRGDETEIHRRLVRSGLPFGTCRGRGLRAPRGDDGVPADPRRPAVGAVPRQRGQAVLHLPQPRLPHGAAGHAVAASRWSWCGSAGSSSSTAATRPAGASGSG